MPKDSYVLEYFTALEDYLSVGVPVYFVVKKGATNYSDVKYQNMISYASASSGCNVDSLLNQISRGSLIANYTHIAIAANSWLDDYFDWLSSGDCCQVFKNDTGLFCPSTTLNSTDLCVSCPITPRNDSTTNRPGVDDFYKYFKFYMKDNPGIKCAKGEHAAYGEAVEIINDKEDDRYDIGASFFMDYTSVGLTSKDFIESLRHATQIADNVTLTMQNRAREFTNDTDVIESLGVFSYSVAFVFYEQYLTIWRDTAVNLSISILAIFCVTVILLGLDLHTSLIITLTIVMIVVNMFAAMFLLGIELNAVSLVNLVMAVVLCSYST